VAAALQRGERPDLATTMAGGPLDEEESVPCHADTLRDALRRIGESAWLHAQAVGVQSLYLRQLVRGTVYAVDGSGLGDELRLVAQGCVSATCPIIVAWRVLSGAASEKGQEAAGTCALIEQVLEAAGPKAISWLLTDALYTDGPLLAWLKYHQGIMQGFVQKWAILLAGSTRRHSVLTPWGCW
jgi:hypothetical protein